MLYNMLNNILFLRLDILSSQTGHLVQLDWTACPLGLDSYISVMLYNMLITYYLTYDLIC